MVVIESDKNAYKSTSTSDDPDAVSASGSNDLLGGGITPKQAMDALRKAMQEDYGYAWSWHCNVAMAAVDAGAPHKEANERAAGFMRNAFGVDTRLPPNGPHNRRGAFAASKEEQ